MNAIKRIIAVLAAVALCLTGFAMAEDAQSDGWYRHPGYHFIGEWNCERVSIVIEEEDGGYSVVVAGSNSATESSAWMYHCVYDVETGTLVCEEPNGVMENITVSEDAEEKTEVVYTDGDAVFSFNDEGQLIWEDKKDNLGEDRLFDYVEPYDPIEAFEGTWTADRATLTIEIVDGVGYALIHWGASYDEAAEWAYENLMYDEVSGGLTTFETGVKTIVKYGEGGEVVSSEVEFDDGAARFILNEDGSLVWTDFKETPGENELVFERAPGNEAPSVEALAEDYFGMIAAVEQGTAGASLKLAQAAADAALFAADYGLWDPDVKALRANMLQAWEGLPAEEQAAFDGNFLDVVRQIDACLNDWESVQGVFEDAGAAEEMEMILYDPLSRLAWSNLVSHTLTMGNSDAFGDEYEMEETSPDGLHASIQHVADSPEWVANLPAAQDENVTQLFVIAGLGMDKTTATISMHERDENGAWKQILSTPGFVGRNGLCADADHVEGCGQTPIGVYRFNAAFGIAADPGCAMPYFQVDDNTYWSGDPDRQYNQMVDIRDVPDLVMDDSEHIVDYEYQYQYCLNISFNEDGAPGRGSAIFLHCFGPAKPYTGGCVALPENIMKMVMQTVREDCVVVIDTLENMNGSF